MRLSSTVPAAGLVLLLAGCGVGGFPTPTVTATGTGTPTPTPTATPTPEPTQTPTTVAPLPSGAFLQVSVTATVGDSDLRLVLTFDRPVVAAVAQSQFDAIRSACPHAIASQIENNPGFEPTGVILSKVTTTGTLPEGASYGVSTGGVIASIGDGPGVAAPIDPPGGFGCGFAIVSGPAKATFASLLLGTPAIPDRQDLENAVAKGVFGFQTDADSAFPIVWHDCVIQIGSLAKRLSTTWTQPAEWDGCQIGYAGGV
ncbi:MAG: hypothetical protein ABI435_08155 [Pseudolysinimonas sp.]